MDREYALVAGGLGRGLSDISEIISGIASCRARAAVE